MILLPQQGSLAPVQPGCWTSMDLCLASLADEQNRVSQFDQNNCWSFLCFHLWSRHFLSWVLGNATFRAESKASWWNTGNFSMRVCTQSLEFWTEGTGNTHGDFSFQFLQRFGLQATDFRRQFPQVMQCFPCQNKTSFIFFLTDD